MLTSINLECNEDEATLLLFSRLGISLAVGMFVGLQRQQSDATLAGMRTFALIASAGNLSAMLDQHCGAGGWIMAASIVSIGAIVVVSESRPAAE